MAERTDSSFLCSPPLWVIPQRKALTFLCSPAFAPLSKGWGFAPTLVFWSWDPTLMPSAPAPQSCSDAPAPVSCTSGSVADIVIGLGLSACGARQLSSIATCWEHETVQCGAQGLTVLNSRRKSSSVYSISGMPG